MKRWRQLPMKRVRGIWPWIGLVGFAAVVIASYLLPELGAAEEIARLQALLGLDWPMAHLLVLAGRKLLHVTGYGVLALSLTVLGGGRAGRPE